MANPWISIRRNLVILKKKPPCLWWLQATFFKYIFHLLSSRLFMHFIMLYFVSFRCIERIFILFSLMGWPEYLFPTNFQIPLRIKLSSRKRCMYIVVQCGLSSILEDGTTIYAVDCVKFSVLVNQCVRPLCSLGDFTHPKKRRDSPIIFVL